MWGPIIIGGLLLLCVVFKCLQWWVDASAAYHEYVFVLADRDDLSPETLDFFDRHAREMERIGFQPLGDFILSLKPLRHFIRVFSGPDPRVLGDVDETNGVRCSGFASIFSDGTAVESNSLSLKHTRKFRYREESVYKINHMPDASEDELYASHLQRCNDYCRNCGCETLAFEPDQFREVLMHVHRLMYWSLFNEGFVPEPPPCREETAENVAASV